MFTTRLYEIIGLNAHSLIGEVVHIGEHATIGVCSRVLGRGAHVALRVACVVHAPRNYGGARHGHLGGIVWKFNPFAPTVAFLQLSTNMCCPRDCVSRHNGRSSGAPLKPLRDDSALRVLSSLGGLRGAPEVPPLCRETQSLGQHMLVLGCENATVCTNGLKLQLVNFQMV